MHSGDKRLAARAAADEIRSGMIVGLGTGSTVAELIPIVAARLSDGLNIVAVATSEATATAARAAGINIVAFEDIAIIDLTIDGVDEIDGSLRAIKGAGGALLREKIIATASRRMIAIADGSKHSPRIGRRLVPVEILPFARSFVLAAIATLGALPALRRVDGVPPRSDQGNPLANCAFPDIADWTQAAAALSAIPGLLGHGLFLTEIDALYIADAEAVKHYECNVNASRCAPSIVRTPSSKSVPRSSIAFHRSRPQTHGVTTRRAAQQSCRTAPRSRPAPCPQLVPGRSAGGQTDPYAGYSFHRRAGHDGR
jgi:ribose 5-phosphate isomerase A